MSVIVDIDLLTVPTLLADVTDHQQDELAFACQRRAYVYQHVWANPRVKESPALFAASALLHRFVSQRISSSYATIALDVSATSS